MCSDGGISHQSDTLFVARGVAPFEKIYGKAPPLSHIRVFGCRCYRHNQKRHGDKFADRSIPGIFIGYPPSQKGWRVYCPDTGNIIVSRDVIFSETVFPFSQVTAEDTETSPPTLTDPFPAEEEVAEEHGRPPITTDKDGSSRAADPVVQPADGDSRAADSVRPTGSGAAGPSATGSTPATGPAGGVDETVPGVEPRVVASIPIAPEHKQGRG